MSILGPSISKKNGAWGSRTTGPCRPQRVGSKKGRGGKPYECQNYCWGKGGLQRGHGLESRNGGLGGGDLGAHVVKKKKGSQENPQ